MNLRVALLTGAASRLGAASVRELHAHGWNILLHYRQSKTEAQALSAELNIIRQDSVRLVQGDLARDEDIRNIAMLAEQSWGQLDGLVNNASTFYPTPVGKMEPHHWDDLFSSNARAPLFLSQALQPLLVKSSGSIVNMVDIHASAPLAQHTIYCMAKAALVMMTKSLALEFAPHIRVNAIAPGAILWPESSPPSPEAQQRILSGIPAGRLGEPSDIARTVRFLLEEGPYITGQIISVDGGRQLA